MDYESLLLFYDTAIPTNYRCQRERTSLRSLSLVRGLVFYLKVTFKSIDGTEKYAGFPSDLKPSI